jgi:hypothetical protein
MRKDNIFSVSQKWFVLEFFHKELPKAVQGHLGCGHVAAPVIGQLKVHKHEIFFITFLQKPKPYGPKGCNTRFLKIAFDSTFKHFRACSACDEIGSSYAQHAMKFVPHMLSVR